MRPRIIGAWPATFTRSTLAPKRVWSELDSAYGTWCAHPANSAAARSTLPFVVARVIYVVDVLVAIGWWGVGVRVARLRIGRCVHADLLPTFAALLVALRGILRVTTVRRKVGFEEAFERAGDFDGNVGQRLLREIEAVGEPVGARVAGS